MSVTKYQIYLKTVELGSFTAAARALNFTQSGVSHAIGSLEEELGVTLLVRSHGGVTPTADGRALAPYFQEMCALSHRLEQHAEDLRGLDTGLIRVATFTSVSEMWLPGMLKTFQEKYPRIEFELLPSNFNNEISDWVLHGQADCGFISLPTPAEKYLDYWLLQRDQWKVILPCDHPLAGRDPFPPEALEQYPLEGTEQRIPLLEEVLPLFTDRAPLIVELKAERGNAEALAAAASRVLKKYKGAYCVESFDPRCLMWLWQNEPDILRGQLSENFTAHGDAQHLPGGIRWILSNQQLNVRTRPDFIAYRFEDRGNLSLRLCRGFYKVQEASWTVRDRKTMEKAEAAGNLVIFEHFDPRG